MAGIESDLLREGPGTVIGPYELLEQIGEGGFGVVFRAQQREPIERQVALKIIKLGMDTRQVVARFEQERQALALMDHPHIARVIDAGATLAGRPYFVMELVNGAPIVDYCDTRSLTISERLELFEQVCAAVQHAHQKGIIHRDIKPSNLLVTEQDGQPQVKVIDFGIAKATSSKLTSSTLVTAQMQVIGTLQYMSPEQAAGSLDIDTRTDVYALGVVLYELLTGATPFDKDTLRDAAYSEIQRMIRELDPPKPSTRLDQSGDSLASLAAQRHVDPRRLTSIVRGELDWIVMRSLEKDRARRYESAGALALDVRRFLSGDAVVAAPPSAAYRLRKFVRRNRLSVSAGLAVAGSMLAGVIAFAWQANVAAKERDAAHAAQRAEAVERQRAERNESKAATTNQFLLDMLASADVRNVGRDAKVSQALDYASRRVSSGFEGEPEVEAGVRAMLGRTYASLGMLDEAAPHVERALELMRETGSAESLEYARNLSTRGNVERVRGKPEQAARTYEEALALTEPLVGREHTLTLGLKSDYANALVLLGRYVEAEAILRESLALRRALGESSRRDTQILINSLAVLLHDREQLDEAEMLYREALAIGESELGVEHLDTLTARMNLGSMLRSRGELEEAEQLLTESYAGIARILGDTHPKTAQAAAVLADLYRAIGRFKDALPLYEAALETRLAAEGANSLGVAEVKGSLGFIASRMGQNERAVTLHAQAAETFDALQGPDSRKTLGARIDLANALVSAERSGEAEPLFLDLLERCPRVLGEDHERSIVATNSYAVMLLRQARYADAEPYLRKALEAGRRAQGPNHGNTLITQHNLCSALRELGRLEEAEQLSRETLEGFVQVFGARHGNTATARTTYARALARLGRKDEALREHRDSIAISKAAYGERNPAFFASALEAAEILIDTGQAEEAEPLLREVVEVGSAVRGAQDARTASSRVALARCLTARGEFTEAEAMLLEAHARLTEARPPGHADIRRAEERLAELYGAWNAVEPDPLRSSAESEWKSKASAGR